ncbi:hypothetical protein H0G86_006200 [Trichoderma simmonsii]|uniref:Uncharacterized protein n=1 Tax=Trichoderma simmonsii TaxID=1491479 RepID=A0A8G0LB20_9HYPO|nr:hypothetical protein H0G86_006200 [Trichoderma simmonsii]
MQQAREHDPGATNTFDALTNSLRRPTDLHVCLWEHDMPSSSAGTASIRGWVPCCIFLANHQALRRSTSTARIAHPATNLSMESLKVLILVVHNCSFLVEHEEPCRHSQP